MFDPFIYRQYTNSPKLIELVQKFSDALLFKEQDFPTHYLNIKTANTQGLDIWGIYLNQPRIVRSGLAYDGVFGFDDGVPPGDTTSYPQNFYHSNFFNPSYSPTITLNNDQYRALLQLLYNKYTTNNSLYDLNIIIQQYATMMSAPSMPYVTSTYDMKITYTFPYVIQPYESYLFRNTNTLPSPAGVKINFVFS